MAEQDVTGQRMLIEQAALAASQSGAFDEGCQRNAEFAEVVKRSGCGLGDGFGVAVPDAPREQAGEGEDHQDMPVGVVIVRPEPVHPPQARFRNPGLPHQNLEIAVFVIAAEQRGVRSDTDGQGEIPPDRAVGKKRPVFPAVALPRFGNSCEERFAQSRARGADFIPLEGSNGKIEP